MTEIDGTLGRTIRMYLVDGSAGGIVTAEIINWTGKVVVAPRSRLPDLFLRPEVNRTGVYILTGDAQDESQRIVAYIGETDDIRNRLSAHNSDDTMEFFNRVCLVVSKDENLTKSHVRFLESQLIRRAREANRVRLVNRTDPEFDLLPESDKADMAFFLQQIELMLPALGYDLFKKVGIPSASVPKSGEIENQAARSIGRATSSPPLAKTPSAEVQFFELNAPDVSATAYEAEGEFIVEARSGARKDRDGVGWDGYKRRRDQLVTDGLLVQSSKEGLYEFREDVPLRSPSEAACIVLARSANGRNEWVVRGTTRTYNQWLAERLQAGQRD